MTSGSFDHFTRRAMERAGIDRATALDLFHDLAKAVKMYDTLDPIGHAHIDFIRKVEYNRRMFRCNVKGRHMVAIVSPDGYPITIITPEQSKRYKGKNTSEHRLARLNHKPHVRAIAGKTG